MRAHFSNGRVRAHVPPVASNRCFGTLAMYSKSASQRLDAGKATAAPAPTARHALPIAFMVLAQFLSPAFCSAQDARPTYVVSGVVENSLTHQPIARALVEGGADAVLTDSKGRFELHLPAGMSSLIARRPGYESDAFSHGNMRMIDVTDGMAPLTVTLTPDATLNGEVTLSGGDDPEGIPLSLYGRRVFNGHSRWMPVGKAITGSDGTFHMLLPDASGPYVLCAAPASDHPGQVGHAETVWGYAPECYPGGADVASAIASPLSVSPGQQAQLEVALARQLFYRVAISVPESKPGAMTPIQVFDRSGRPMGFVMRGNQQSGGYEFYLPNGSYYAESRVWGGSPGNTQLYGRADFTVSGAPFSGITVVPTPEQAIPVEIHEDFVASFASGDSALAQRFEMGDQPPFQISLTPVDRPFDGEMGLRIERAQGSSEGVYEMIPPGQGTYRLNIQAFGRYYAASVTSGKTDLLQDPLVIGPGNSAQPIEITLRNDMGFLECTSKTAPSPSSTSNTAPSELAPIFVSAISLGSGQRRLYNTVVPLPNSFKNPLALPPGNYLVLAFEKSREIDLDDADAISRLSSQGQSVTIQPGATVELQVDPTRSADEDTGQ